MVIVFFNLGNAVTRAHEADALNPLTRQQELENSGMKP